MKHYIQAYLLMLAASHWMHGQAPSIFNNRHVATLHEPGPSWRPTLLWPDILHKWHINVFNARRANCCPKKWFLPRFCPRGAPFN